MQGPLSRKRQSSFSKHIWSSAQPPAALQMAVELSVTNPAQIVVSEWDALEGVSHCPGRGHQEGPKPAIHMPSHPEPGSAQHEPSRIFPGVSLGGHL